MNRKERLIAEILIAMGLVFQGLIPNSLNDIFSGDETDNQKYRKSLDRNIKDMIRFVSISDLEKGLVGNPDAMIADFIGVKTSRPYISIQDGEILKPNYEKLTINKNRIYIPISNSSKKFLVVEKLNENQAKFYLE